MTIVEQLRALRVDIGADDVGDAQFEALEKRISEMEKSNGELEEFSMPFDQAYIRAELIHLKQNLRKLVAAADAVVAAAFDNTISDPLERLLKLSPPMLKLREELKMEALSVAKEPGVGLAFQLLVDDLAKNLELSPWAGQHTSEAWLKMVGEEIEEIIEALQEGRLSHAVEEFGDTFWNLISAALALQDFGPDGVIQKALVIARAKLRNRKPWIYDGSQIPTDPKDEEKRYSESKKKEAGQTYCHGCGSLRPADEGGDALEGTACPNCGLAEPDLEDS